MYNVRYRTNATQEAQVCCMQVHFLCSRIVSCCFHQMMPLSSKYSVATFLTCFGTLFFINLCFSRYTFLMKGISDASNKFRGDQCTSN